MQVQYHTDAAALLLWFEPDEYLSISVLFHINVSVQVEIVSVVLAHYFIVPHGHILQLDVSLTKGLYRQEIASYEFQQCYSKRVTSDSLKYVDSIRNFVFNTYFKMIFPSTEVLSKMR